MYEISIRPINRYSVTVCRIGEMGKKVEQVAENLTLAQARDIAGAVHARAQADGIDVRELDYRPK